MRANAKAASAARATTVRVAMPATTTLLKSSRQYISEVRISRYLWGNQSEGRSTGRLRISPVSRSPPTTA